MTITEKILIVIIWIGYGLFAAYQTKGYQKDTDPVYYYVFYPLVAPLIFICRCLYGAFKQYRDA